MKKLSTTLTELGIAFSFPIDIKDANGNVTYYENGTGYWARFEYDAKGKVTYRENSQGDCDKWEYDADGNVTYFEDSTGDRSGTPRPTTNNQ